MEIERLTAYFDGDVSSFKTAGAEAIRIADAVEKKFKSINTSFKIGSSGGTAVKDAQEMVKLQTAVAAAERANEQAKRATIQTGTEQLRQDRERLKLQREIAGQTQILGTAEQQAKRASINNSIQEIRLQREQLKLAREIAGTPATPKSVTKATIAPGFKESEKAAARAAQMVAKFDNQLAKLKGNDTELAKLNRLLAQPGVAAKIDETTKALLRQKAAAVDAARAAVPQKPNGNGLFSAVLGGNLASRAVTEVTGALISGGSAVLDYSAKLEQAKIGFTTMTGSADLAQKHLEDLQRFAQTTPFEFIDLVEASQKLQGVGVASQKVIPLLKDVGNALAAAGRIGDLPFAVKALGDIQAKGKLAGQEIIQLANAGLPALDILSQSLGKSKAEVIKLSESGKISADTLFNALHQVSEVKFGDAMEKQSRTFNGALSNIKDGLYIASSTYFAPLYASISEIAVRTSKEITNAKFGDAIQILAKNVAKGFGEALATELRNEVKDYNWTDFWKTVNGPSSIGAAASEGLFGKGLDLNGRLDRLSGIDTTTDMTGQSFLAKNIKLPGGYNPFYDDKIGAENQRRKLLNTDEEQSKKSRYSADLSKTISSELQKPAEKAKDGISEVNSELGSTKSAISGLPGIDSKLGTEKAITSLGGVTTKLQDLQAELVKVHNAGTTAFEFSASHTTFGIGSIIDQLKTKDPLVFGNLTANPIKPVETLFGRYDFLSTQKEKRAIGAKITSVKKAVPELDGKDAERTQKLALIKAEQSYKEQDALLKSHLVNTTAQQLAQTKTAQKLELDYFREEIKIQKNGFAEQIAAAGDDADKKEKITAERNDTLAKLEGELKVKQITNGREIAELEKRSYEERRQAQIEFKKLLVRESEVKLDKKNFNIERAITFDTAPVSASFERLKTLTQTAYGEVTRLTREQFDLQLQDVSLTTEQKNNLIKQQYLDEQDAAEKNRRTILQIEDNQYKEQISRLESQSARIKSAFDSRAQLYSGIGEFFNPQSFNQKSLNNFEAIFIGGDIKTQYAAAKAKLIAVGKEFNRIKASISDEARAMALETPAAEGFDKAFTAAQDARQSELRVGGEFNQAILDAANLKIANDELTDSYDPLYSEIYTLGVSLATTADGYKLFDQIAQKSLFAKQTAETASFNEELKLTETRLANAKAQYEKELVRKINTDSREKTSLEKGPRGTLENSVIADLDVEIKNAQEALENYRKTGVTTSDAVLDLQSKLNGLKAGFKNLGAKQAQEETDRYKNSLGSLPETLENRKNGKVDPAQKYSIESQILQQQISAYDEIALIKARILNLDATEKLDIEKAGLEDIIRLRQLETEQIIQGNRTLEYRLQVQLAQIPSYGEIFKQSIADLPGSVADVLGQVAQNWDGTWKGLFESVKQGFGQMLQNILQQYLQAAVSKLIGQLVGFIVGAIGGGIGAGGGLGDFGGGSGGYSIGGGGGVFAATGGLISGPGTATSDSIPASLSDGEFVQQAKAVDFYGVEFMNAVNNLELPPMKREKFSGGGLASKMNQGSRPYLPPPDALDYDAPKMRGKSQTGRTSEGGTVNNITLNQTIKAPRGMVAAKSARQASEHALGGVARATRDSN